MKKLNVLLTLLFCSVFILQSCKKDDDDNDFLLSDQEFVSSASSNNSLEISAGQLAATKGVLDTVKSFGAHMVTEHTLTGAELTALAITKGWVIPTSLQAHHQNNLNLLTPLTGSQFDLRFAELMVITHQEAVALFQTAASTNGVPDSELRSWAASKIPALQSHLQASQALYIQLNATATQ